MSPELLAAIGGGELLAGIGVVLASVAAIITAIVGPTGIAALFRRRSPESGPAAAARSLETNLSALAEALTAADQRAEERDRRAAVLEDRIRNCPVDDCPPRRVLDRENP